MSGCGHLLLGRDGTTFQDQFRADVGPAWNTQHVGVVRGPNWINTWFSAHDFGGQKLFDVPPRDLLVWYAPREGAQLRVLPEASGQGAGRIPDLPHAVRVGRRRGTGPEPARLRDHGG